MDTWRTWELVTELNTVEFEHIPAEVLAHQVRGLAACDALPMVDCALREGYNLRCAGRDLPRSDGVGDER